MGSWLPYLPYLNPGDNAWQMTAATLVGLMSVPGLVILYGGVMQKRWSVNSMMMSFVAFALVLVVWVLYGFKMGFGDPWHGLGNSGFFGSFIGKPASVLSARAEEGQAIDPVDRHRPAVPLPAGDARLLPVRVRGDHADPDARLGPRPRSTSRPGSRSCPLGLARLHGQRVPDLGWRILRRQGSARLLGRLRDPPRRRGLGLRRRGGDRPPPPARPGDRRSEQPADGGVRTPACSGSAGTASTVGTPITPAPTHRRRSSTRTSAPRSRCSYGSAGTTSLAASRP